MSTPTGSLRSKTSQACEPCRALKVRCLPGTQPSTCKKCEKSGASCIFAEQRPRQKSTKPSSKARVAALESKLDELLSSIGQAKTSASSTNRQDTPRSDQSILTGSNLQSQLSYTSPAIAFGGSNVDLSGVPIDLYCDYPHINASQSVPDLVLIQCGISIEAANGYLLKFRSMSAYFPFVMLPEHASMLSLSLTHPFLTLAALTAATSQEKGLQRSLDRSFRIAILQKVMLDGERGLDLLQAILVYIGWYQFYYIPKKDQSYQLIQMAIGLCMDLGLNLRPVDAVERKVGLHLQHYNKATLSDVQHDDFFCTSARRAYLGCYQLSTSICNVIGKPNNIQYTQYMADCGGSLTNGPEYPSDSLLLPLVQLQNMADVYHDNLRVARYTVHTAANISRVQAHRNAFQAQLQRWKQPLGTVQHEPVVSDLAQHFAELHVYEMDLINPFTRRYTTDVSPFASMDSSFTFTIRLELLLDCLHSSKAYLDAFLTIPKEQYQLVSFVQWTSLIGAVVTLYKLSLGTPNVPEWDVTIARQAANFEFYINELCARMEAVSIPDASKGDDADLFSLMSPIYDSVRETYYRLKHLPQSQSSTDKSAVHATNFPKTTAGAKSDPPRWQHKCPAFPFWSNQTAGVPKVPQDRDFIMDDDMLEASQLDDFADFGLDTSQEIWENAIPTGGTWAGVPNFTPC